MIELAHVRYFHEVARAGGFTKAARNVHVQQPSVSRAVRLLEEELGVVLFGRDKRSVTLTKVGREIFEHTSEIMRRLEAIAVLASNERNVCSGTLAFAAQSGVVASLVPEVNARLRKTHPDVWPLTHTVPVRAAVEPLARGDLEFGVFFHLPAQRRSDLSIERIGEVPFALVIDAKHARDASVLESFIGSREIEDEGTRCFPTLDRLRRDYPKARIRLSCNDVAAQKEMVRRGLGVAVLPRRYVARELRTRALVELYENRFTFPLFLLTRRVQPLSRAASVYIEALRAALAT
jgi:DNA-binding transcriptional LysR family regulator